MTRLTKSRNVHAKHKWNKSKEMRRVTRKDRWGKLTNNQIITMAHLKSTTKSTTKEHPANENQV